jgi:hypothetical protein
LTEDHQWLSATPKGFESTPYSQVAFIQYTISPYCRFDGTLTRFDISKDGQTVSYSVDGTSWHDIDYQKWSSFIFQIISAIKKKVAWQMSSGMTISKVASSITSNDFLKMAPYRQHHNMIEAKITAKKFQEKMESTAEANHGLFKNDGTLRGRNVEKYIERDQDIKALLCTLLVACSTVPMRPWQFASIVFNSCPATDRNLWIIDGRFVVGKPKAKQRNVDFADTAFWFPRDVTTELIAYLYYQQPFISHLLAKMGIDDLPYASHVWTTPSKLPCKTYSNTWNSQDVNREVWKISKKLTGTPKGVAEQESRT